MTYFLKFITSLIIWRTTNWPNHATSDHQEAKNQNYPIFLQK